jgi:hypothetical protein
MKCKIFFKSVFCAGKSALGILLIGSFLMVASAWAQNPGATPAPAQDQPQTARLTPEQLQELVAPIALYPDALVAQILAASAYPTQIVEAERFLQQNPNLKGKELGDAVNQQDWDPSVKALTQFPSVLANLDKDLSWTSELGDANYNQQADVMQAVQYMRKRAEEAGNLKTTPQQTVTAQGPDVSIDPADPNVVYVPEYDPALVYGYPVGIWPGFSPWWGVGGPYLSFGVGFGIGPFFGFGWGWPAWGSFVTEADLMRSTVMLSTTATPIFMETTGGSGLMDRVIASRAGLVDQGNIVLKRAEGQGTEEA